MNSTLPSSFNIPTFTVAALALIVSFRSMILSQKALRLNELKEAARRPALQVELNDTMSKRGETGRFVRFDVSIKNRSDDSNSVSRAELLITCVHERQTPLIIKVQAQKSAAEGALNIPIRIDAHQTVLGQFEFDFNEEVVTNCSIRKYVLLLTDASDKEYQVERSHITEISS